MPQTQKLEFPVAKYTISTAMLDPSFRTQIITRVRNEDFGTCILTRKPGFSAFVVSPILLHFVVGFAIPRIFRPIRSHTTKLIAVLGKEPYSIQRSSRVKNKMFETIQYTNDNMYIHFSTTAL